MCFSPYVFVSILVLVDESLEAGSLSDTGAGFSVSILVLVDESLEGPRNFAYFPLNRG